MIHVTVYDEETGDRDTMRIGDGPEGYVITCGPGCHVSHIQKYANGTVVVTIKPVVVADPEYRPLMSADEGSTDAQPMVKPGSQTSSVTGPIYLSSPVESHD